MRDEKRSGSVDRRASMRTIRERIRTQSYADYNGRKSDFGFLIFGFSVFFFKLTNTGRQQSMPNVKEPQTSTDL